MKLSLTVELSSVSAWESTIAALRIGAALPESRAFVLADAISDAIPRDTFMPTQNGWLLSFGGLEVLARYHVCFETVRYLLANPDRVIPDHELLSRGRLEAHEAAYFTRQEVLDPKALRQVTGAIESLKRRMENEGDPDARERLAAEVSRFEARRGPRTFGRDKNGEALKKRLRDAWRYLNRYHPDMAAYLNTHTHRKGGYTYEGQPFHIGF